MTIPYYETEIGKRKKKSFDKIYKNAPIIKCACGCGTDMKSKDKYGRDRKYVSAAHANKIYDDPTQFKREWNHRNREARYRYKKIYIRRRKVNLIKLKGGKCMRCGIEYDGTNATMFDMHHRDPLKKKMLLSMITLGNRAWAVILEEAKKCDLLCSNCHRIEHTGGW